MKKITPIVLLLLLFGFVSQAGFAAYAAISNQTDPDSTIQATTGDSIDISAAILEKIEASDLDNYDRNLIIYRSFLVKFDVSDPFKQEIERLILLDYPLTDIWIAYEFLYHNFGHISELEALADTQQSGITWEQKFIEYNRSHEPFTPREFASETLEKLIQTPTLTPDDIMIADRLSFITDQAFETWIEMKLEIPHWQEITAQAGILYSEDTLPRVQIAVEEADKYTAQGLSEEQVVHAFVLANRTGLEPKLVIEQIQEGQSEEAIMADSFTQKYN